MKNIKSLIIGIFLLIIISVVVLVSGVIQIGTITPALTSKAPMQVSEGETITITASISNSPVSGAAIKVMFVSPNQLITTDSAFMSTMNTIGITGPTGAIQYTIPTGVVGKVFIYAADKPSALISPGFKMAYVI